MRLLVTAGPTREPIDPVRYLANRSSGQQGTAIAAALAALGLKPIEAMRVKETEFKAMGLARDSDDETLIRAMATTPRSVRGKRPKPRSPSFLISRRRKRDSSPRGRG